VATSLGNANNADRRLRVRRWLSAGAAAATDLLFPPRCRFCAAECTSASGSRHFCINCESQLATCTRTRCRKCGLVCSEVDLPRGDCGYCRGLKLRFSEVRTLGSYEGPLRQAVLKIKHAAHEPLAVALGQRMAEQVVARPLAEAPDLVTAVPMHWLKRIWRRTNTALTLAESVAKLLGLPHHPGLLVCRRLLARQATLTPPQRRINVRNAFRTSRFARIDGKRVLLVDDVMTTGATAQEAARTLLTGGAATVFVATVARSTPDF
jgi:ComF family protein